MSADYYARLEQGRETGPSAQIVDSLARALQLDHDARTHLYRIAGLSPRIPLGTSEIVDPALLQLISAWPMNPALVLGQAYDVLAGNALGEALFSGFTGSRNLLERVFLDDDARHFYADWDSAATNTTAGFRLQYGQAPNHPRVRAVLDRLLDESSEFATIWSTNRAIGKQVDVKTFVHSQVGALTLRMLTFDVRSTPGQQLVVYQAEVGTASADAVALLGTLSATDVREL